MAIYRPQLTGTEKPSSLCATACLEAKKLLSQRKLTHHGIMAGILRMQFTARYHLILHLLYYLELCIPLSVVSKMLSH